MLVSFLQFVSLPRSVCSFFSSVCFYISFSMLLFFLQFVSCLPTVSFFPSYSYSSLLFFATEASLTEFRYTMCARQWCTKSLDIPSKTDLHRGTDVKDFKTLGLKLFSKAVCIDWGRKTNLRFLEKFSSIVKVLLTFFY